MTQWREGNFLPWVSRMGLSGHDAGYETSYIQSAADLKKHRAKLGASKKILVASDFHFGGRPGAEATEERVRQFIDFAHEHKPETIVLLGDMTSQIWTAAQLEVNGHPDAQGKRKLTMDHTEESVQKLAGFIAQLPKESKLYLFEGNHDSTLLYRDKIRRALNEMQRPVTYIESHATIGEEGDILFAHGDQGTPFYWKEPDYHDGKLSRKSASTKDMMGFHKMGLPSSELSTHHSSAGFREERQTAFVEMMKHAGAIEPEKTQLIVNGHWHNADRPSYQPIAFGADGMPEAGVPIINTGAPLPDTNFTPWLIYTSETGKFKAAEALLPFRQPAIAPKLQQRGVAAER